MTYRGEQILSDDDFLKALPLSLDSAQRLTCEGLAHIADSLWASYRVLLDIAVKWASRKENGPSTFDRALMFNCAWSIVDDIDAARQLFGRIAGEAPPRPGGFRHGTESFRRLRNKMDHLSGNVPNLVAARAIRRPIFGALSFLYIGPGDILGEGADARVERGRSYCVTAGTISDREIFQVVTPQGAQLALPIDDITLGAFDIDVRLGEAIALFARAVRNLSVDMRESCRAAIEAQLGTGEEARQAMAQVAPYGLAFVAEMEFPDNADNGTPVADN